MAKKNPYTNEATQIVKNNVPGKSANTSKVTKDQGDLRSKPSK